MSTHPFTQLDVFTDTALKGNPLAVVHDAARPDATRRCSLRALDQPERNHLPAAAHRRRRRLPRAHLHARPRAAVRRPPDARQLPRLARRRRQAARRGRGGAAVRRRPGAHPPRRRAAGVRRAAAAAQRRGRRDDAGATSHAPAHATRARSARRNGSTTARGWVAVLLGSRDEVLALQPDFAALKAMPTSAWSHPARRARCAVRGARLRRRRVGPTEDPVTGSLNAGLAQWLIGAGLAPARYVAAQGTALGRAGRVHVEQRDGDGLGRRRQRRRGRRGRSTL